MKPEYIFVFRRSGIFAYAARMRLHLESYKLHEAERLLCEEALTAAGSIVEAASLLGITRHALKRRIIKHRIEWPRKGAAPALETQGSVAAAAAE
ncbi:MAG: hypothetical protein IPK80_08340 [Nannocystis sp.]|nr:hypothetical protein [Nannocystis sp.]